MDQLRERRPPLPSTPLRARLRLRQRSTALGFTPALMCPLLMPMKRPPRCAASHAATIAPTGL